MPRRARKVVNGKFYHVMVQGINKENIFLDDSRKYKYYILIEKYLKEFEVDVIAYCIMSNHVHLLLHSKNIDIVSRFMHKINGIFAQDYNKENKRVGYVFRDRFKMEYILNEEYLYACIDYIHMNPVKANIVDKAEEYKFSSFNEFWGKKKIINLIPINFEMQKYEVYKNNCEINNIVFADVSINKEERFYEIVKKFLENEGKDNLEFLEDDSELRRKLIFQLVIVNGLSYNYVSKKFNISRKRLNNWLEQKGTGLSKKMAEI